MSDGQHDPGREGELIVPSLPLGDAEGPVRKAAQRLRWFVRAFEAQVATTADETGHVYRIDTDRLSAAFAGWLQNFNLQKPSAVEERPAYVGFAAGLMLRELIAADPVSVDARGPSVGKDTPAGYWPEGYVYVTFCLNVRGLVLQKDYNAHQSPSDDVRDVRTWWSFRENVAEDGALALAFLDLFAGVEPDWTTPALFSKRAFGTLTKRYFVSIDDHSSDSGDPG